jgi:SOS-response transcriptional repressor LexA
MHEQMERLYRAAKELRGIGTKAELARALNQSFQTVKNWETRGMSKAGMLNAQAELGCSATWLETGKGAMTAESPVGQSPAPDFDENVRPSTLGTRRIPVISAVQAGALRDMDSPYEPGDGYAVEYTDDMGLSRWTFALDIEGLSMMPEFRPGDRVIVDPEVSPNPGDFVVARNGSNQATFKKYRPRGIDQQGNMIFELVPLNDDYPTLRSDTEHLIVIGVLMEHRKKYRRP